MCVVGFLMVIVPVIRNFFSTECIIEQCYSIRAEVAAPLLFGGYLIFYICGRITQHYFYRVYSGIVVKLDMKTNWRRTRYDVQLKGLTLAGEEKTYWVRNVPWRDWHELSKGSFYCWGKGADQERE
jgi:hypothetical protein